MGGNGHPSTGLRCILMAAGSGSRWNNYTRKPKHLLDPTGGHKPLITRLCEQLDAAGVTDLVLIGPQSYREHIPAHVVIDQPCAVGDTPEWLGATKFANTMAHWSTMHRTVILYGDCWIEDESMHAILSSTERSWLNWCRHNGSPVTGRAWGENFAVSFWPEHHDLYRRAMRDTVEAHRTGVIARSGGWEISRVIGGAKGLDIAEHRPYSHHREIGFGFTDDFDYPADLDMWRENWRNHCG